MTNLNSFNRAVLIVGSLIVPIVGIIAGIWYIARPERKNDYLGVLCLVLGIIGSTIYVSIPHFF